MCVCASWTSSYPLSGTRAGDLSGHPDIGTGQLAELEIAGDPGKNTVLISRLEVLQGKIGGNDDRLFPKQALVEGAPSTIKEGVSKDAAKEIETKLKEAGATVELK